MAGEVTLQQLMLAPVITRAISRIKTPMSRFQDFYGLGIGGPRSRPIGGHYSGWDIFDKTRSIAQGRPSGVGPATISANPIGHVDARIYRAHEKLPILDERVFKTRPLGQPYGNVDNNGQTYITAQEAFLAQRFKNSREFMVAHMFRGGFSLLQDGENWTPVALGDGTIDVDFKIPAGNKDQLDMLGGGDIITTSFDDPAADIIGFLFALSAAGEQLHGYPYTHAWCRTSMLKNLMVNEGLVAAGGSANTVFAQFTRDGLTSVEGIPSTGFEYVARGFPTMIWHAYDGGLDVNGTYSPMIDPNHIIFTPDPGDWVEMHEGSEPVRENVTSQSVERYGFYSYSEPTTQPAGNEIIAVDNCIPALMIPKAVVYAEAVFS